MKPKAYPNLEAEMHRQGLTAAELGGLLGITRDGINAKRYHGVAFSENQRRILSKELHAPEAYLFAREPITPAG